MNKYLHGKLNEEDVPVARKYIPVTQERLKEEVAAYMREKGMNPWYASHMMELIKIGWKCVEEIEYSK